MVVPFFFRKSCATGGQTLRRLDSRSTCTAHRMRSHWRTQKKPTLQEKSRKLAYWQDRTLSRRKSLSYELEHEHGCRSRTSPGCDQLSPSCSPVAQNWAAVVIYLFNFLFIYYYYLFIYLFYLFIYYYYLRISQQVFKPDRGDLPEKGLLFGYIVMMVNVNKAGIDNEEGVQTVWEEDKWWLWLSAAAIWKF